MFRKLAEQYIAEHDAGKWTPFTRDEKASILLFAEHLDEKSRNEQSEQTAELSEGISLRCSL